MKPTERLDANSKLILLSLIDDKREELTARADEHGADPETRLYIQILNRLTNHIEADRLKIEMQEATT